MKLILVFIPLLFICELAEGQTWDWEKKYGMRGVKEAGYDITSDKSGNIYTLGNMVHDGQNSLQFDSIKLAQFSEYGNTNVITKHDSNGQALWVKSIFGPNNTPASTVRAIAFEIISDDSCNIYVFGSWWNGTLQIGEKTLGGLGGFYVTKLDSNGNLLWVSWANTSSSMQIIGGMCLNKNGTLFISGSFLGTITFDSDTLITSQNNSFDAFIAKYTNNGSFEWAESFGGPSEDGAISVVSDESGNIYCTGTFEDSIMLGNLKLRSEGEADIFVFKCDSLKKVLWVNQFGYEDRDVSKDMALGVSKDLYVVGISNTSFNNNGLFLKFDTHTGRLDWWQRTTSSFSGIAANGVEADKKGNVYFTGYFFGDMTIGNKTLDAQGGMDIFLVKYANYGTLKWARRYGWSGVDKGAKLTITEKAIVYIVGEIGENNASGNSDYLLLKFQDGIMSRVTETTNTQYSFYPNPSTGIFYLDTDIPITIDASNSIGVTVFQGDLNHNQQKIDLSASPSGIYFVKMKSNGKIIYSKLILNK